MARTVKRQSRSKLDDIAKAEKAALAARLRASGRSLEQIAAELGVSRATAHRLVEAGSSAYLRQSQQPIPTWVDKAIADLLKAAQENWTQWERSKQDRYQKKTINKPDGTVEVQEIVEPQCGAWLLGGVPQVHGDDRQAPRGLRQARRNQEPAEQTRRGGATARYLEPAVSRDPSHNSAAASRREARRSFFAPMKKQPSISTITRQAGPVAMSMPQTLPPRWWPLRWHEGQQGALNCTARFIGIDSGRRSGRPTSPNGI